MKATQICSVEGCERTGQMRRGLCGMHYLRMWRSEEFKILPVLSLEEQFAAGLERKPNGCLEWTGPKNSDGYGRITVNGKDEYIHRLAWTMVNGPIPEGMVIRHFKCDNPPCADLSHLRLGTHADNVADKMAKGHHPSQKQTRCKNGHEFTPENTQQGEHQRRCRTCHNIVTLAAYHKRKAEKAKS